MNHLVVNDVPAEDVCMKMKKIQYKKFKQGMRRILSKLYFTRRILFNDFFMFIVVIFYADINLLSNIL